jgi:hypothetical protein
VAQPHRCVCVGGGACDAPPPRQTPLAARAPPGVAGAGASPAAPAAAAGANEEFWNHEWTRHGTCAGPVLATQHEFFGEVLDLHHDLNLEVSPPALCPPSLPAIPPYPPCCHQPHCGRIPACSCAPSSQQPPEALQLPHRARRPPHPPTKPHQTTPHRLPCRTPWLAWTSSPAKPGATSSPRSSAPSSATSARTQWCTATSAASWPR